MHCFGESGNLPHWLHCSCFEEAVNAVDDDGSCCEEEAVDDDDDGSAWVVGVGSVVDVGSAIFGVKVQRRIDKGYSGSV
jgi:hypothetical protein